MSAQAVLFDAPGPKMRRNIMIANVVGLLLLLALAVFIYLRMDEADQWRADLWQIIVEPDTWRFSLLPGLQNTVVAAGIAIVLSLAFGFVFGIGRLSGNVIIRSISGVVVEFFRAVPVLIMMIAAWLLLAQNLRGLVEPSMTPLYGVVIGLTLYNGSVIAELIRSGVAGLPKGQREAAFATGMTRGQSIRSIELPQALIAMLPSLVSQFVVILKDTALGSIVTYNELLRSAEILGSSGGTLQIFVAVAVVFIVINWLLTKVAELLATRIGSRTSGRAAATTPGVAAAAAGAGGRGDADDAT